MYEYSKTGPVKSAEYDSNSLKYAAHVFDCENTPPSRIPSDFPISTAIMHTTSFDIFPLDNLGNAIICLDLSRLMDLSSSAQEVFRIVHGDGVGTPRWNPNSTTTPTPGGLGNQINITRLSSTNVSSYRIVSIKLKLRYIGSKEKEAGIFFACHSFDQTVGTQTLPSLSAMQDSPVFQANKVCEGMELAYKPYDNSYLEFNKSNTSDFNPPYVFRPYNMYIGCVGGEISATALVLESFMTLEYIPSQTFVDNVETEQVIGSRSVAGLIGESKLARTVENNPLNKEQAKIRGKGSYLQNIADFVIPSVAKHLPFKGTTKDIAIRTEKFVRDKALDYFTGGLYSTFK